MSVRVWRDFFYAGAVVFLAIFVYRLFREADGQFLSLLAACICLVAARFEDIAKFKFSKDGLEGEMRQAIDEAKATVTQLNLLGVELSKAILWSMQAHSRLGGTSIDSQDTMREKVLNTVKTLGASDREIAEIKAIEYPYIDFDYSLFVTRNLSAGLKEEDRRLWNEFYSADLRKGIGFEPSPDELEEFLRTLHLLNDDVAARLEDYRFFKTKRMHRRPQVWKARLG
ncbi:hypothetical protein HGO38_10180 [Rhizobium sp. CG5]|uniref:hypothetical protein n=1 Tax=Rhizobium sp. CG5 TaxID=2726076 RepID=UPI0020337CE2|nr:hypothetical protein [Rhizobium sp. CG5]MCM2473839.1 hypothetical protein [Rhizobium sp. CG5]